MPLFRTALFLLCFFPCLLFAQQTPPSSGSSPAEEIRPALPAASEAAQPSESSQSPAKAQSSDSTAALWEKGNEAIRQKKWDDARDAYQIIVDRGDLSAQLFLNLGIAEYRRDRRGEAVLGFSRSLALDPRLPEARQNLETVRKKAPFASHSFLEQAWFKEKLLQPKKSIWVLTAWASGWIVLLSIIALVWWTPRTIWPVATAGIVACCTAGLAIAGVIVKTKNPQPLSSRSIVIAEDVSAHAAPAEISSIIIPLPPGSEGFSF